MRRVNDSKGHLQRHLETGFHGGFFGFAWTRQALGAARA
jgi:hypothetical protein